jgi:hypothetical protein
MEGEVSAIEVSDYIGFLDDTAVMSLSQNGDGDRPTSPEERRQIMSEDAARLRYRIQSGSRGRFLEVTGCPRFFLTGRALLHWAAQKGLTLGVQNRLGDKPTQVDTRQRIQTIAKDSGVQISNLG